ncbi:MAG TPA: SIS domain-containing protein [Acidobacteriota bacterium]|nr:SIS domain-containing protein [Acidobacteriota bacterium]HNR39029.1 SIS domain-containing protein [Acidobacteriota bacterium]HNT99369.1 SIS domain-containing protein [Acidobacteriota bacterium]HPB28843.1 SIS domain-containing protein [Acidobacteriota bacterium]HQO25620.1 SIS domain-containing protein [Acidobacteriota bacterium]
MAVIVCLHRTHPGPRRLSRLAGTVRRRIAGWQLTLPVPVPAVGCGVLGMVCARRTVRLGEIASRLLEKLEYRGYDSTGLCIQDEGQRIVLKKSVGAPSNVVKALELETLPGRLFCGQVRWATFGAVDDLNAQPHLVACKTRIYGAHNGNLTNCEALKDDLRLEGHVVLSDNDGEMLVHTMEHFFFLNLEKHPADRREERTVRRACMIEAIRQGSRKIRGSYAAVIVDPVLEEAYAIKSGSSLYVGKGSDDNGDFILTSSDLSAVLSLTRILIPLSEGEFIHFDNADWTVYSLTDPRLAERRLPKRSKLRVRDMALRPPFQFFMEQEIAAQGEAAAELIDLFHPGNGVREELFARHDGMRELVFRVRQSVRQASFQTDTRHLLDDLAAIFGGEDFRRLEAAVGGDGLFRRYSEAVPETRPFASVEEGFLQEMHRLTGGEWRERLMITDTLFQYKHRYSLRGWVEKFARELEAHRARRIYMVACGSSYNAARAGAAILNRLAGIPVACMLPGEFRAEAHESVTADDLFIGISQSGETKDLVDICNALAARVPVRRLMIVNNVNSTLAQEKCDFYLPILCGPEIAVPATKSFTNQLVLLFGLALKCLELRGETGAAYESARQQFLRIPQLLDETHRQVRLRVRELAEEIYLSPSAHILSAANVGLAREGALKIREVVLNHSEGMEASEFKHGPNTILGKNFTFGLEQVQHGLTGFTGLYAELAERVQAGGLPPAALGPLAAALADYLVHHSRPFHLRPEEERALQPLLQRDFYSPLFAPYPLLFLTPPTQRDVELTISQINTHKIRGAAIYVIAEENEELRQAAVRPPADAPGYRSYYLTLPRTGSELLYPFSAVVALQMLALEMSVLKMKYLNRLKIPMHGVHPDVPKNVSKSITVD